jgi:hypothetical protein
VTAIDPHGSRLRDRAMDEEAQAGLSAEAHLERRAGRRTQTSDADAPASAPDAPRGAEEARVTRSGDRRLPGGTAS